MSDREWIKIGEDDVSITWAMPIMRSGYAGTIVRVDVYQIGSDDDGDRIHRLVSTTAVVVGARFEELQR